MPFSGGVSTPATAVIAFIFIAVSYTAVSGEHPSKPLPAVSDSMPLPFTRELSVESPLLTGDDVFMMQALINRSPFVNKNPIPLTRAYDTATAAAVSAFQTGNQIPTPTGGDGTFDSVTASVLLELHLDNDGYEDDGLPLPAPYHYKVYIPIFRNRSIEVTATLFDRDLNVLRQYTVRCHGQNDPSTGVALNQFTSNGVTPTGLSSFDLNSPEDDPKDFGPYPVNRFVQGLKGNALIVIPNIRDGILQHTGEWPNWNVTLPMPNSDGCTHAHPNDVFSIWQILVGDLGVAVRNNTNGALPYPYQPQGLVSVELQDP